MLHAVVMAGGSGTRFWPRSRERFPKQFLTIAGDRSLLQGTMDRIQGLVPLDRILIVTNARQSETTAQQLPELPTESIIGEPFGRDTAACIGLAAELLLRKDPDARMIILAADHLIQPFDVFRKALQTADHFLMEHPDALVTFGIKPTHPSTAYGYLSRDENALPTILDGVAVFHLDSFHEKPKRERAEAFVASGFHYWNSGIFAWRASTIVAELERFQPTTAAACRRIAQSWDSPERQAVFAREYEQLEKISIDFAIMEKTQCPIHMIEAPFAWDDVGSWLALERVHPVDNDGNVVLGRHVGRDTTGCIMVGDSKHVVATLGVKNLIIVQTPDATLVADRTEEQSVKKLLDLLRERGWLEYL